MVGNGGFEKTRLMLGEAHRDRFGFDLASPAPMARMIWRHAAIGKPTQASPFFFENAIAILKFTVSFRL